MDGIYKKPSLEYSFRIAFSGISDTITVLLFFFFLNPKANINHCIHKNDFKWSSAYCRVMFIRYFSKSKCAHKKYIYIYYKYICNISFPQISVIFLKTFITILMLHAIFYKRFTQYYELHKTKNVIKYNRSVNYNNISMYLTCDII